MSPEGFFDQRREWSRWKHKLLQRYLGKFTAILGSRYSTVYFVDGFAGAGRYSEPSEDGSPVIAARLAGQTPANHRPYTLRCINVEPKNFDELVAATSGIAPDLVENRRGTFREHFDSILETVGSSPALFFLDPFGHKGMEWDVVSRIAGRSQSGFKVELLMNFASPKIDRDGGWIDSTGKAAPAFVKRLDVLFGTSDWQGLYRNNPLQEDRIEALASLYMGRLAGSFSGAAARFPVRTIEGKLKYYVIHGTHSPIGSREMSDVVYRVSEEYRAEQLSIRATAPQLRLFPTSEPTDEEREEIIKKELAADILRLAASTHRPSFNEIQNQLLPRWFGRAVEKHFRAACKQLVADGKVTLLPPPEDATRYRGGINGPTRVQFVRKGREGR